MQFSHRDHNRFNRKMDIFTSLLEKDGLEINLKIRHFFIAIFVPRYTEMVNKKYIFVKPRKCFTTYKKFQPG